MTKTIQVTQQQFQSHTQQQSSSSVVVHAAPELAPGAGLSAVVLLAGLLAIIRGKRQR